MLVFTVSIVTNNSLEIDYSQGHYIKISSIMHGTHFLPFTHIQVLRTLIGYYRGFSLTEMKNNWYSMQINSGEIICINNLLI